ncbi:MAG: GNAT family N-acetyltransferase [Coriobacteriales bacterium]|nr:GNAT family N-acetyltransferase [Coriobacteriales bacterium]
MPQRPLPTGDEPPKGFESVMAAKPQTNGLRIDCAFISQLHRSEILEIEALRALALANVGSLVGLTNEIISFDHEISLLPGKQASDKLMFRAYRGKVLVGYALVVIGWPNPSEWVIQHLVINPEFRLQGIGTDIVKKIEDFAQRSEVDAASLFAIPLEERGTRFWEDIGYCVETGRHPLTFDGLDHELIVYRKEL